MSGKTTLRKKPLTMDGAIMKSMFTLMFWFFFFHLKSNPRSQALYRLSYRSPATVKSEVADKNWRRNREFDSLGGTSNWPDCS